MLAEALQKFADLITGKEIDVGGEIKNLRSTKQLYTIPLPEEPPYPTVELISLEGLVEWVSCRFDFDGLVLCGAQRVQYCGLADEGQRRQRMVYARVTCKVPPLDFGQYRDLEHFRIELLSRFVPTPDLEAILGFTAKLTQDSAASLVDDGVSQTVTAKVGIATQALVTVPSPCRLRPVRTFREVEQPEGLFVFRLRKGAAGGVEAALFEHFTDWERVAALNVVDYLTNMSADKLAGKLILA